MAQVLAQVDSPHVAAVWDIHHPYRMGESIEETWRLIGSRVKHVHIKDGIKRADGSWQLVLLGQGELMVEGDADHGILALTPGMELNLGSTSTIRIPVVWAVKPNCT